MSDKCPRTKGSKKPENVSARKFIDFADEKDRLWKVLGRIRKKGREHGPGSAGGLWKSLRYGAEAHAYMRTLSGSTQ